MLLYNLFCMKIICFMNSSRKNRIEHLLQYHFQPLFLDVINESSKHRVPVGAETHFKLILVSAYFDGKTRIQRHRMVLDFLKDEFSQGLHACTLSLYSNIEWEKNPIPTPSPLCAHQPPTHKDMI